jgi:hypothetical protein
LRKKTAEIVIFGLSSNNDDTFPPAKSHQQSTIFQKRKKKKHTQSHTEERGTPHNSNEGPVRQGVKRELGGEGEKRERRIGSVRKDAPQKGRKI